MFQIKSVHNGFLLAKWQIINMSCLVLGYLIKIPGLKILRIYGQEIERKVFPVPDKVTTFRSKRIAVQLKADEELKEVSLHHVIRSPECPFAEELKEYDQQFKEFSGSNAPLEIIKKFNKVGTVPSIQLELSYVQAYFTFVIYWKSPGKFTSSGSCYFFPLRWSLTWYQYMLLTEREVPTGGYCTVEFFFRFFRTNKRKKNETCSIHLYGPNNLSQ